ncbi:uncharacterized protein LOC134268134 [Saccostrea cucullata]|uniref:uncharacterized protein LOC134268134 n=1 Tax=Saccostrea cuccullata TaxID=36930 RepID=UPI002ED2A1B9
MDSFRTSPIKTALQHMSESVFMVLCVKLGTAQQVAMRRDVEEISNIVVNQVIKSKEDSEMRSGSRRECLGMERSDVDYMIWPKNHCVIWELSQSHSEYRKIQCSGGLTTGFSDSVPHGPCVSAFYGTLECDFAFCFASDFWPPSASSWIDRCHSWPQPRVVDNIVKNGCHFVAIGHTLGHHVHNEWRISFSFAEHKLVCAMNHCQFLTYGLLKLFLTEIINKGISDDDKLLCSYHMKTAVFWMIQQNTLQHWCPQTLLECFWVCFKLILKWVYDGICPNFFIPQNNMFLSKVQGEAQHQLFLRLHGLYEKGLAFLLHIPSIRSCIINVFHNPHLELSICTDKRTLISEIKCDIELFGEIYKQNTRSTSNIQICMKYLHIIEQMIESPLLTQYQVVMLQKFTATVLKKTAFMLYMEPYTHRNKVRFRADKISCHMLKLAAKFGCISDLSYIAMYYYNTLRYMEALSIIEMIKVKLAQPYVMYMFHVNVDMYIAAVGGKSWSTKIRQAVAWYIKLDNKLQFINELIPEQMSNQNDMQGLHIPPFVLLYMLEILCYRHVDTMRVQTALDDLQTLVHYDQDDLIDVKLGDISWQILGICQQITGNLQAALYSYKQSLRQEPFHKIQTATEMRISQIIIN